MDFLEVLRWVASITGIVAAILVAMRLTNRATGIGFIIFTICSVSWVTVGAFDDEWKLAAQNMVLTLINLVGVYRWLIKADSVEAMDLPWGPAFFDPSNNTVPPIGDRLRPGVRRCQCRQILEYR